MLKYVKYQKMSFKKYSLKSTRLNFGLYGLKLLEHGEISQDQLEFFQKMFLLLSNNELVFWFRLNVFWPKTCRPLGARMGSGKGLINRFVLKIPAGSIFFETYSLSYLVLKFILLKLITKFGMTISLIKKSL